MSLKQKLGLVFLGALLSFSGGRLSYAGNNQTKTCAGGQNAGKVCSVDADCTAADPGEAAGVCRYLGHYSQCQNKRYCAVSTTVECDDNLDCPLYPGNPNDFCYNGAPWDQ